VKKLIGLLPAHPSQIWILNTVADSLKYEYDFKWYIRDKDISCTLADELSLNYKIISRARRGLLGNFLELLENFFKVWSITRKEKIDLWISKYSAVHMVSKLLGNKSIFFVDDDYQLVPILYLLSCPCTDLTVIPEATSSGRFKKNMLRFNGLFELVYLSPGRFTPDISIFRHLGIPQTQRFCLIRLASLSAHHDIGATGVRKDLLRRVLKIADAEGIRAFITSEDQLPVEFDKYRLSIPLSRIHHALFFADFVLGDSQTMASEAVVLGTPAFRINSFVGKIGCINDLERKAPSYGYKPDEEDKLVTDLEDFIKALRAPQCSENTYANSLDYEDPLPVFCEAIHSLVEL